MCLARDSTLRMCDVAAEVIFNRTAQSNRGFHRSHSSLRCNGIMNRSCQLESQKLWFARGRSAPVRLALILFMASMLGSMPSVYSTLRACCEEGSEEVRLLEEESIAVAHRRVRQKSLETKHRRPEAVQYSFVAPRVLGAGTTHVRDRSTPAQFLLGAGIRIRC